jgi:CBS domain-containing protein
MSMTGAPPNTVRPLRDRLVAEAMHDGVVSCGPETPLRDVAELMAEHRIHSVVVDEGGGRWGVVSDLDLVAAASVRDLAAQTAGGSAASPVVTIAPGDTVDRAGQLMTEHETAHLLVVDPDTGRPVGVLSTLDVAQLLSS